MPDASPATPSTQVPVDTPLLAPAALRRLLWLISAGFFMQSLDTTIVNTAVPAMAEALRVSPLDMRGALTSYVLTLAIFIPASPWLCNHFGTRRVFAGALAIFSLGSLLCGCATSLPQLILARIVQGLGGAALMPVGRYVLARTIDRRDFVRSMSTVATVGLLGSVIGPLLGGVLVQFAHWRWIFLINIPVGLAGWWLNQRAMPDYRSDQAERFDLSGFILFASASALLLYASELLADHRASLFALAICVLAALGCAASYVWHCHRTEHPVADLRLLQLPTVRISLAGNLFTRLGVSGMYLLVVIYLQVGCGWSPLQAGLMMLPQAAGSIAAKWMVAPLLDRMGYRLLLTGNALCVVLILLCFGVLGTSSPALVVAALMFIYGAFMGVQYTAMNTLIYVDLDRSHAAMASSMASTAQYLSMSFGIAAASVLMSLYLTGPAAAAYVTAFHWTVLSLAAMTLLSAGIFRQLTAPSVRLPLRKG
ncbi:MFS transporter [Frateuria aurantia]